MKSLNLSIIISFMFIQILTGQNKPLIGSGKLVNLNFSKSGYDKVNLEDFEGNIDIQVGKPHNVRVQIDDNLAPRVMFELDEKENELTISIKDNKNGRLYLENIHSKITITLPEVSVIRHRGNSSFSIIGVMGRYFRLENQGNGDAMISGTIDDLDILKIGNGAIYADKLLTKNANISTIGNGNVVINVNGSFSVKGAGNGNVIQKGRGWSTIFSKIIGNGDIFFKPL